MKRVLNPGLSLWLSALYDVMVMLGSVHSQHTLFFLFRPLPGLKPTPRDMAHRRWDLPAGCFSSESVFCCDDFLINGSHEAPWRVCLERLENTETSKKKKKHSVLFSAEGNLLLNALCPGFLSSLQLFISLLNVPLFHCCQKMSTLLQLNLSAEHKLSDATHMPINHTTPNKKEARENTVGTLLALCMSYFGHVGM